MSGSYSLVHVNQMRRDVSMGGHHRVGAWLSGLNGHIVRTCTPAGMRSRSSHMCDNIPALLSGQHKHALQR